MVYSSIGREIREQLDEHVAQLYADLDGGLSHLAWLLPGWLPLPSFRSAITLYVNAISTLECALRPDI